MKRYLWILAVLGMLMTGCGPDPVTSSVNRDLELKPTVTEPKSVNLARSILCPMGSDLCIFADAVAIKDGKVIAYYDGQQWHLPNGEMLDATK